MRTAAFIHRPNLIPQLGILRPLPLARESRRYRKSFNLVDLVGLVSYKPSTKLDELRSEAPMSDVMLALLVRALFRASSSRNTKDLNGNTAGNNPTAVIDREGEEEDIIVI